MAGGRGDNRFDVLSTRDNCVGVRDANARCDASLKRALTYPTLPASTYVGAQRKDCRRPRCHGRSTASLRGFRSVFLREREREREACFRGSDKGDSWVSGDSWRAVTVCDVRPRLVSRMGYA